MSNFYSQITAHENTTLRDMIRHIRKGEAEQAIELLSYYVGNEKARERVEQYRREPIK